MNRKFALGGMVALIVVWGCGIYFVAAPRKAIEAQVRGFMAKSADERAQEAIERGDLRYLVAEGILPGKFERMADGTSPGVMDVPGLREGGGGAAVSQDLVKQVWNYMQEYDRVIQEEIRWRRGEKGRPPARTAPASPMP